MTDISVPVAPDTSALDDRQLWTILRATHHPMTEGLSGEYPPRCARCLFRWPCPADRMLRIAGETFRLRAVMEQFRGG